MLRAFSMKRYTYRLEVAYDGTVFAGFTPVPGERTVWSALRDALVPVVPAFGRMAAAGRTDRGVSALGQVVSFISHEKVEPEVIMRAVDDAAPGALAAMDVRLVADSFHAQYTATSRRYVYLWPDDGTADVARIDRMLCALTGRRCFSAFARDTPWGKKTVKTLLEARARAFDGPGGTWLRFDFAGDAFLRRQVRVMVATALREAAAGAPDDRLVELAAAQDRRATAFPAPAEGLFLVRVGYDPIKKRR